MNIRKITAMAGSLLMAGLTVTTAAAAAFPAPFVQNGVGDVAVVYGASSLDAAASTNVQTALSSYATGGSYTVGDVALTDDEVELGLAITAGTGADILSVIEDNKLSNLRDEKFSWDDGTGSEDYDIHEEIRIGTGMKVLTTLDDKDFEGIALSNDKALSYRLVFEDTLNTSLVGDDEADTLYLEILGKEYEVESMTANTITVTTSEENSFSAGDTYTVMGKTVTIGNIFEDSVQVSIDGKTEIISKSGTKKIDGIRVKVETIGYNSNAPETSVAVLKIGEDLSKTYTSGEEFVGEDEDDPLWTWDIANLGDVDGYVGVTYNAKITRAKDTDVAGDSIKYVGEGYVFPNNFAAVTLDSVTDVAYQDVNFYFEETEDLFDADDTTTGFALDKPVFVIEAENTDSILTGGQETDKIYLYLNGTTFQTLYNDFDGDYTPSGKMRLANASVATLDGNGTLAAAVEFATITVEDTILSLTIGATGDEYTLFVMNEDDEQVLNATLGGNLEQFGENAEEANSGEVFFGDKDVSTEDYSFMDHNGFVISEGTTVESEVDNDELTLSVPEDEIFAQVTVSMGGEVSSSDSLGNVMITANEVANSNAANLVIVGGSCINSAAATVLGGAYCGAAFTDATGVGAGEFMIKGIANSAIDGKFALVVAGYEAADTTNAVTYLTNKRPDTSKEWKGTTATEQAVDVTSN